MCYHCGKEGHIKPNCPDLPRNEGREQAHVSTEQENQQEQQQQQENSQQDEEGFSAFQMARRDQGRGVSFLCINRNDAELFGPSKKMQHLRREAIVMITTRMTKK